jgi:hypothetical protein
MILAVGAGELLTSSHTAFAYAIGIPSLLALGTIMVAPERAVGPHPTPNRRASDRARAATTTVRWQFDRRASRRAPMPVLTNPGGADYPGSVAEVTYVTQAARIASSPTATRAAGAGAVEPHAATEGHLAARRHHSRRGAPRSVNRISRCRYR